jgi:5-oxopent-3-ene-1,2,5-tricarboxylate decarboxylase/2-hydroxyhepta-2,4-diene-1,7-dioate isomerase
MTALSSRPGKIVAVHASYRSRAAERGTMPAWPSYFLKPTSSLAESGDPVVRPPGCELLAFEGEVALVIGRRALRVSAADGWDHVAWITAANDFGAYDLRYADRGGNVRSKGSDSFAPLGPLLIDARTVDLAALRLRSWVNGELAQDAWPLRDMLFGFGDIVADLSRLLTLEPGDVILTGTPTGSTVVNPGDVVEVEVSAGEQSSGRLRSPIVEADYPLEPLGAMPRVTDTDREAAYGARAWSIRTGAGTQAAPPADLSAGTGTRAAPPADLSAGAGTRAAAPADLSAGAGTRAAAPADPSAGAGTRAAAPADPSAGAGTRAAAPADPSAGAGTQAVLPADILADLREVSTATLAAQLRKHGLNGLTLDGLRSTRPDLHMAGFARTVRYLPLREDLSAAYGAGMNAQKRAIEQILPGEVLVIEARGDQTAGTIGDILALRTQVRGAAGIVTDGAIRDSAALAQLEIPAYHAAVHPAVLGRRHIPWETDVAVACAGVTIQPGDILVGDADGVVVLPPPIAAEILADASEQEREERFIAAQIAAGEPIEGLFPLTDRWRPAYQTWLAQHESPGPLASPTPPPSQQARPPRCDNDTVTTGAMSHRSGSRNPSLDTIGAGGAVGAPAAGPGVAGTGKAGSATEAGPAAEPNPAADAGLERGTPS